jgi:hypothetical protein
MKLSLLQKKLVAFIMLISCVNMFMGCHRYFSPVKVNAPTAATKQTSIKNLNEENKYFILRQGDMSYALDNMVIDEVNMTLTAKVGEIPLVHQAYTNENSRAKHIYKRSKGEGAVLREVHLFINSSVAVKESALNTFSLADIQKIEVIEFNKQKTTSSFVWGTVGITMGVALVIVIIALAPYKPAPVQPLPPNSSCPYISSFDGENYQLQGEIYSAAVYPSLQRDDYLPLRIMPVAGEYKLKISNELKEVQHTDFADLLVASHQKDVTVLIDAAGKLHSIKSPQPPVTALLNNRIDMYQQIRYKDNANCIFKDDEGSRAAEDLYVSFKNEQHQTKGKLVLSTKTSAWLNYLYGAFAKEFGSYYNEWDKEQEKKPASELEKWVRDQHLPLSISIKTRSGWKEIQQVKTIGPLLNRDVVIPFESPDGEAVEFKISGGYLFWELDYAAIDYSPDANFTLQSLKPYKATNEQGLDVLGDIVNQDQQYLIQPNIWDSAILTYKSLLVAEGQTQTFFLHTSGYYKRIRNFEGKPKVAFLKSFSQPGAMAAFSRQKYWESWNNIATSK